MYFMGTSDNLQGITANNRSTRPTHNSLLEHQTLSKNRTARKKARHITVSMIANKNLAGCLMTSVWQLMFQNRSVIINEMDKLGNKNGTSYTSRSECQTVGLRGQFKGIYSIGHSGCHDCADSITFLCAAQTSLERLVSCLRQVLIISLTEKWHIK